MRFTEENKKKYQTVLDSFENYFVPKKNLSVCRHKFFSHVQGTDTLDMFLTKLKKLAADCEFKELQDSLIRDMFICNMNKEHANIRQKLLVENDIGLDKMILLYRSLEISQRNNVYLEKEKEEVVQQINQRRNIKQEVRGRQPTQEVRGRQPTQEVRGRQPTQEGRGRQQECMRCGNIHYSMWVKCPAYGVKCNKCSKTGHFAKMCRTPISYVDIGHHDSGGFITHQIMTSL
ncbi:uncharacterized protein LOC125236131 [Leguminivora glycinivorella]|uniref:uncharacterized protein LOC125236131 n=1 Tax=Leguminivora glycinivorella TaxID=1035111 RepID=UPI00200E2540|nr:uncharacterized protein LOC125236131 [Leguminivora glycinivorella]